jgi:eukaryotic-like serine/threonine-protein kinase
MNCPACEAAVDPDDVACARCGELLEEARPGSILSGRYEVQRLLGRGGMGVVYRAHDRALDEDVAVKVLRADIARARDIAERFRAEIRLARKVGHRNVCRIYEYGEHGGLRYIAMELVDGVDLKAVLRAGALPADRALDVVVQVGKGLEAIHEHGIIHRDLKTSNIMIDGRGVVRLMDFGIAKQLQSGKGVTATGHIVGTPEYMSPEQAKGVAIDVRSDIYSLGIVAFEIYTGEVPFHGDTPISTILQHLNEPPPLDGPRAAHIPPTVVPIIAKALAKNPDDRFASAREMVTAFRAARPVGQVTPTPLPLPKVSGTADWTETAPSAPTPQPGTATRIVSPTPAPAAMPDLDATVPQRDVPTRIGYETPRERPIAPRDLSLNLMTPEPRGRSWVPAAVGAVLAVVLGVVLARHLMRPGAPTDASPPVSGATSAPGGAVARAPSVEPAAPVDSPQPAARRVPSSPSPRTAPAGRALEVAAPYAGRPAVAFRDPPPTTAVSRPVASVAAGPPSADAGTLRVSLQPEAEVTIDNESMGSASTREFALSPGPHVVRLTHPDYQPLRRVVTIATGKTIDLKIVWAEKGVPKER